MFSCIRKRNLFLNLILNWMKKYYLVYMLLVTMSIIAGSCKKQSNEIPLQPSAEASFIRNLVFSNQVNVEKSAVYGKSVVQTEAIVSEGNLAIRLYTTSNTPGAVSESVTLYIKQSHIGDNLAKGYTFGTVEPALNRIFYAYSVNESAIDSWASLTDSRTGIVFQGLLNITAYDTKSRRISGTFDVRAKRLIVDPTKKQVAEPIDPLNQCDLFLTGTFANVAVQQ